MTGSGDDGWRTVPPVAPPNYPPPGYPPSTYPAPNHPPPSYPSSGPSTTWQSPTGPGYGGQPPPRPRSSLPVMLGALIALLVVVSAGAAWFLTSRPKHTATAPAGSVISGASTDQVAAPTFGRAGTAAAVTSAAKVTITVTPSPSAQSSAAASSPSSASASATSTAPPTTTSSNNIDTSAIAGSPYASAVRATFAVYFGGVNAHDASVVNTVLIHKQNVARFEKGIRTTTDDRVVVLSVNPDPASPVGLVARVQFRSTQEPDLGPVRGQGCTRWDNTYHLRLSHGQYQILRTVSTHVSC